MPAPICPAPTTTTCLMLMAVDRSLEDGPHTPPPCSGSTPSPAICFALFKGSYWTLLHWATHPAGCKSLSELASKEVRRLQRKASVDSLVHLLRSLSPCQLWARLRGLMRSRDAQELLAQKEAVERAHQELLATQRQLLEAEKLATLGTLAGGVA